MKLNSTTFLRISALILVGIGAYGIYAWQIKEEKVVIKEVGPVIPTPWYYYAIPLALLIFVGSRVLAKHPFKSPVTKTLAMFALLAGIAFCGIKTFDSLKADPMFRPTQTVQASPNTSAPSRPIASQQSAPAPTPPRQETQEPQRPQYSYEQCWQIVRRAANDNSVAVPPECREAQEEFERQQRAAEEARQQQERDAAEARERQRQEQERIAEQQRREEEQRRAEAEENRRRNEAAQRAAEEQMERDRQERARKIERLADSIINKIRRKQ